MCMNKNITVYIVLIWQSFFFLKTIKSKDHEMIFRFFYCKADKMFQQIYLNFQVVCQLAARYYHVTCAFQSQSTLYISLNVKKLLGQNRHDIWNVSDSKGVWTHDHLVRGLWVWIPLLSTWCFFLIVKHILFDLHSNIVNLKLYFGNVSDMFSINDSTISSIISCCLWDIFYFFF